MQPKKNQKIDDAEVGNNNNNGERNNGQSSSSCSSNDELNESQEVDATNPNGKTRASRGTATDPQSLYARVSTIALRNTKNDFSRQKQRTLIYRFSIYISFICS